VALDLEVRGATPFAFQWHMNGGSLPGETNHILSLDNVQPADDGDYSVIVRNAYSAVTSAVARVTVLFPPLVVAQPQSTSTVAGATVIFTVGAVGSPKPSYQWTFDGVNIPGATGPSYSISNVQQQHAGTYAVGVQNSLGYAHSAPASLRIVPSAPVLVKQPADQSLPAGSDARFTVEFYGTVPIECRWFFDGAPLNVTGPSLVITNIQALNSGYYTAVLSNSAGQTLSSPALLTVIPSKPWFVLQPLDTSVPAGSPVTFRAAARGSMPLGYQWRKDGMNVLGGLGGDLVLTNVAFGQSGVYDVIATNSGGSVTSLVANLVVTGAPPVFVQHPASLSVNLGEGFTLQSMADGTGPVGYQWFFKSASLPNETTRFMTVTNAEAAHAGPYFVVASNAYGRGTSSLATVTVLLAPRFKTGLANQVVNIGQNLEFTPQVQGGMPITYHWFHNNLSHSTSTNATFTLSDVKLAHAGVYRVVASNSAGTASAIMVLHVLPQPGTVITWGDNSGGQSIVPSTLVQAVKTVGGDFHTIALMPDGAVAGWGFDGDGQASPPAWLSNVVSVAAGPYHSLALLLNGQVAAWGYNASGQATVPSSANGGVAIAAGESHSIVVRQDGSLVVWGDNTHGQRNIPANSGFVTGVAAGRNHTVALRNNGTVFAWGQNSAGQASVPEGLTGVKGIAAGFLHSLGLRDDGTVVAWGDNTYGQRDVPPGLSNVVAIAAGDFHSYALRADGTASAWGDNAWGQIGLPSLLHHVRFLGSGCYHGAATVEPFLNWVRVQGGIAFSWAGPFALEEADTLNGTFKPLSLSSPYTNRCEKPLGLFRLKGPSIMAPAPSLPMRAPTAN
jgi:hypothetical protein